MSIEQIDRASLYVNWAVYAITGGLAQADLLLRTYRAEICLTAGDLREHLDLPDELLHRGILLEPEHATIRKLPLLHPQHTFASFSEDHMVACYFADTRTYISGEVLAVRPKVQGWIMTYRPKPEQVLFHWSWAPYLPLQACAALHADIDDYQFLFALRTQREVIVTDRDMFSVSLTDGAPVDIVPYEAIHPCAELHRRFLPPRFHPHGLQDG